MNAHIMNMSATIGDNSAPALDAFDKVLAKLGAESVNTARPKLAIALVKAAFDGLIDEDDVEAKYDLYLSSREKAQAKSLLAAGVDDGNGRKANISKCKQLVKLGLMASVDGPDLADRTVTLRGNMVGGDDKIEAPFDALVKVARAQLNKPDADLTDDEIMGCVRKPVAAEKDAMARLVAAYKAAHKLAETVPMPETQEAVAVYGRAIVEAGGDVPAMTKEEKAEAAFMAQAAKMGFTVSH